MGDRIYFLRTDRERGKSDERLRAAAARAAGLRAGDPSLLVRRTKEGKPYFPGENLHCSVSHSGGIWLCAISAAPVGVDIQLVGSCDTERIAARFFHPDEAEWLRGRGPEAFFEVWCAKESYVKYTGAGILPGLDGFCVTDGTGISGRVGGALLRRVPFGGRYRLFLCGGTPGEITDTELESE
jgi:phosphopantetheinyl transferase